MVDLHTHSTASDGTCSPGDLVRQAAREGIRLLALTDHDTVQGITEAAAAARQTGLAFLAGIEMEVRSLAGEFHLLGLGITEDTGKFACELARLRDNRERRNLSIFQKIQEAGIPLAYEEIEALVPGESMGRPHIARALVQKGVVRSVDEAFRLLLGTGKRFYVEKETPTLEEGIALIKKAGGITVIAHPVTLQLPPGKLKEFLLRCKKKGLDGIEVFHPDQKMKFCRDLEKFGMHNKFILTGGSDYHGANRLNRNLGYAVDKLPIPDRLGKYFLARG